MPTRNIPLRLSAQALRTQDSGLRSAFTLVEMLVVIGIIGILAALLLPAVMRAVGSARNAAIAIEVNQLSSAIEAYRLDKGDYPPNFRDWQVVKKHISKCYPKIDPSYFGNFMNQVFPANGNTNPTSNNPVIDESEALVFWLSMTDTNPRFPFLSFYNPSGGTLTPSAKKYYDFDETRLFKTGNRTVASFKAKYCKDSFYIYIDSRAYDSYDRTPIDVTDLANFQSDGADKYAFCNESSTGVRPYWASPPTASSTTSAIRPNFKPVNPTTFQIICAGQDGEFGMVTGNGGDTDVKIATGALAGTNFNTVGSDSDNITNFSNGKTLGDLIK